MSKLLPLIVVLITMTTAQKPAPRTMLALRSTTRCKPRNVYRDVACLCFVAFSRGVIKTPQRLACKDLFGRRANKLESRCMQYVVRGKLRLSRAVVNGKKVQEKCFVQKRRIMVPSDGDEPGRKGGIPIIQILMRLPQIKDVLDELMKVLDVTFIFPSAPPVREAVAGAGKVGSKLVRYNRIEMIV